MQACLILGLQCYQPFCDGIQLQISTLAGIGFVSGLGQQIHQLLEERQHTAIEGRILLHYFLSSEAHLAGQRWVSKGHSSKASQVLTIRLDSVGTEQGIPLSLTTQISRSHLLGGFLKQLEQLLLSLMCGVTLNFVNGFRQHLNSEGLLITQGKATGTQITTVWQQAVGLCGGHDSYRRLCTSYSLLVEGLERATYCIHDRGHQASYMRFHG